MPRSGALRLRPGPKAAGTPLRVPPLTPPFGIPADRLLCFCVRGGSWYNLALVRGPRRSFFAGRMLNRHSLTLGRQHSVVTYLYLAQIILAITITVLVMLQAKDAGMGNVFGGGDMGVARTRRGVEKTLFNATIVIGILFLLLSLLTVKISG